MLSNRVARVVGASAVALALGAGCGAKSEMGAPDPNTPGTNPGTMTNTPMMPMDGAAGSMASAPTAGSTANPPMGAAGSNPNVQPGPPPDITPPPPEVIEMLDPDVDWEALTIVYPTMYTGHDGMHLFQVPAHVDMTMVELSDWQAIPSDSVTFDPDPEVEGGVLITIERAVPQITIAVSSGPIGGTAALFVTEGTPEQWEVGNMRYANGVEFVFDFAMIDFASAILDPNWMPPVPPPNLACNNCHTTGAKYFEIQHSPTQAARFSDDDLRKILTMGMKPTGVGFRILPPMLGSQTAEEIYAMYHRWETTPEEVDGLILYMRSITPTGQGDIRLPDGSYVPPGTTPDNFPTMP